MSIRSLHQPCPRAPHVAVPGQENSQVLGAYRSSPRHTHRMQWGLSTVEIGLLIAIILVLGTVGFAIFQRSTRLSRESEAVTSLAKIFQGARSYYNTSMQTPRGKKLKQQHFPSTENSRTKDGDFAVMPGVRPCESGDARYPANSGQWASESEPWKKLGFSLNTPHYYRYGFTSSLKCASSALARGSACFTAQAEADLDCNGVFSHLSIHGGYNAFKGDVTRGPVLVHKRGE